MIQGVAQVKATLSQHSLVYTGGKETAPLRKTSGERSVCEHAQKLFPTNVKCHTAHSLAFFSEGRRFGQRLTSKFSPHIIRQYLNLSKYPFETLQYCKAVVITIQKFMASGDLEITMKHTPAFMLVSGQAMLSAPRLTMDQRLHIRQSAVKMWTLISDSNENCPITDDVYLKLYQLSKPVLDMYHCIMVDEAQDCNPVMLDIVLSQRIPKILVGDPHQQIYASYGSINALKYVKSTHTYHLTKSFRFGPEIAYIASCCLEVLKDYKRETLVGCNKPATVSGVVKGQYAIITRSNLGLFNEAIRLCCHKNYKHVDEPQIIHGAFIGGINSYDLEQIEDIYRLKNLRGRAPAAVAPENKPSDKIIKLFPTFSSLVAYAREGDDLELSYKVDLVCQHGGRILEYMAILKKSCSAPLELANVVFTTAHKAKGFEFDTVRLGDDFNVVPEHYSVCTGDSEDANILYVALTRAKASLIMSEKLYSILLHAQETFEYPILSQDLVQYHVAPKCELCCTLIKPHTALSVVQRKVILASGRVLNNGPLCFRCAGAPFSKPLINRDQLITYLDPAKDFAYRSLKFLAGPLPSDPPVSDALKYLQELHCICIINVDLLF